MINICKDCGSTGFTRSSTGKGCTFCDGTESGNLPMTKPETEKLLPCPHCGGAPTVHTEGWDAAQFIRCTECSANTRLFKTREEAVAAWNRRAATPARPSKWHRLDFGRFGGMADFDVGGVTLRLTHGEACIVDGILARLIAESTPAALENVRNKDETPLL